MKRIEFIKDFIENNDIWKREELIRAIVVCLSPEELCELLILSFNSSITLKRALLRNIISDIENNGLKKYHKKLIDDLFISFDLLQYQKKQTCCYYLNSLCYYLPDEIKHRIIMFFINSSYVAIRRRGYKILRKNWNKKYSKMIEEIWEKHKDYECALIFVDHFTDSFLLYQFKNLEETLFGRYGSAKLFLRLGKLKKDILNELEEKDGITYAYVMVKLGKKINEEKAFKIFDIYKFDYRIGLLLWCFGQMKLWTVLEKIVYRSSQLYEEERKFLINNFRRNLNRR